MRVTVTVTALRELPVQRGDRQAIPTPSYRACSHGEREQSGGKGQTAKRRSARGTHLRKGEGCQKQFFQETDR